MADAEIAARRGVATSVVQKKRTSLGIPPWRPQRPKLAWSPEMLTLLGVVPDRQLARLLGISQTVITRKRTQLGIPRHDALPTLARTPEILALLRQPTLPPSRRSAGVWA